ncbi:MAG TPA: hypothetical protein VIY47_11995 [Ignavibacteriaceae bacterium]
MRLFEVLGRTLTLYRGMSQEEFERLKQTGIYIPNINNPHNDATTNLETARYYASEKVHDDPGVVIQFEIPTNLVRRDDVFGEDYKVIKSFNLTNYRLV